MNPDEIGFGAHPSSHDYRDVKDYHYSLATPYPPDYTDDLSEIEVTMQGKLGICTANLCYVIENLYAKKGVKIKLSRRFLYTVTKHYIDQDTMEGSSLRSVLKAAYKYGVAPEEMVPTNVSISHEQFISDYTFTPEIWAEALKYRIGGYISIGLDRESIANAISTYGSLYARMEVGEEWFRPSWRSEDILPLKKPIRPISGHAVVPFEYKSSQNYKFLYSLRNSWSKAWANNGNGNTFLEDYAPTELWAVTLEPIVNELPKKTDFKYTFTKNMELGQLNDEITQLQIFLKIKGYFDYPIATGFYGEITQRAVYKFQCEHIAMNWLERYIYKGRYCGIKTIKAMNAMM